MCFGEPEPCSRNAVLHPSSFSVSLLLSLWLSLLNPRRGHCLALQAEGGDAFHNLSALSCPPEQCHYPFHKFHCIKLCRSELGAGLQKAWKAQGRETHWAGK